MGIYVSTCKLLYCSINPVDASTVGSTDELFKIQSWANRIVCWRRWYYTKKKKSEIEAHCTPFLNPDFSLADIIFLNGQELRNLKVNLNLETNEVYYTDSMNRIYFFNPGVIKTVSLKQARDSTSLLFKSGYPEIGKKDRNYFYQSIEDGDIELLKQHTKTLRTTKNEISGEIWKEYIESGVYYVFVFGLMKELRYDKSFLLEFMEDKRPEIEKYLSANKTSFKKIGDIRRMIHFYNELKN